MKKLISALLCLLVLSSCSDFENKQIVVNLADTTETETVEDKISDDPETVITFDNLDNFSFTIETNEYVVTVAGDNINGSKSILYVASPDDEVIYELNTKGGSKFFVKNPETDFFEEFSIEYSEVDFYALYELLSYIGIDYREYYGKAEFSLEKETEKKYVYTMTAHDGEYTVHVDKESGVWVKVEKDGETMVKVKEFSLEKAIIPNH